MVSCDGRFNVQWNALCQSGFISHQLSIFLPLSFLLAITLVFFSQALLSGCSAGGLASILHCDEFRDLFPKTTRVKCLSDAGLFLDV